MNRTNAYRDLFDTELARQGLEIRPFLELEDDVLALRLLYENPAYMTVLPLYTVKKSIHEKSLAAVRVEDCKMSQFRQVIYHKNKVLTPQIRGCWIPSSRSPSGRSKKKKRAAEGLRVSFCGFTPRPYPRPRHRPGRRGRTPASRRSSGK